MDARNVFRKVKDIRDFYQNQPQDNLSITFIIIIEKPEESHFLDSRGMNWIVEVLDKEK